MKKEENRIELDIDKVRLQEIVKESVRIINEYFSRKGPLINLDNILGQLDKVLSLDRVTVEFTLNLNNKEYPDLKLKVDPRRRRILCRSERYKKKATKINRFLKVL